MRIPSTIDNHVLNGIPEEWRKALLCRNNVSQSSDVRPMFNHARPVAQPESIRSWGQLVEDYIPLYQAVNRA